MTSHSRVLSCVFIATMLSCCSAYAVEHVAEESVSSLIKQLDSKNFQQREQATRKLSEMPNALGEIAQSYFKRSAEASWRLKKIFTNIAHQTNDEATSVKAIAILLTLDSGRDVNQLLSNWQKKRSQNALDHLISKGATSPETARQARDPFFERLTLNGVDQSNNSPEYWQTSNRLSIEQQQKQVLQIVKNSLAENNELVSLALTPGTAPGNDSDPKTNTIIEGRAWVGRNRLIPPIGGPSDGQVSVTIGKTWNGTDDDFRRLKDIHNLYGINFENQQLQTSQLKLLAKLNIQHLGLSQTKVQGKRIAAIPLGNNFESISLERMKIEEPLMKQLAETQVRKISISNCTIEGRAVNQFDELKKLTNIELTKVRITKAMWEEFSKLENLRSLQLSVCKYKKLELSHFKIRKPGVAIRYVPVAFLGVQTNRFGDGPCEVSVVVADTAADRGGLEAGDIIETINGQPVDDFNDLRQHLAQYDINETLLINISRADKPIDLRITLGSLKEYEQR